MFSDFTDHITWLINTFDNIAYQVSDYMLCGVITSGFYWSAVSYGAITIVQVN